MPPKPSRQSYWELNHENIEYKNNMGGFANPTLTGNMGMPVLFRNFFDSNAPSAQAKLKLVPFCAEGSIV